MCSSVCSLAAACCHTPIRLLAYSTQCVFTLLLTIDVFGPSEFSPIMKHGPLCPLGAHFGRSTGDESCPLFFLFNPKSGFRFVGLGILGGSEEGFGFMGFRLKVFRIQGSGFQGFKVHFKPVPKQKIGGTKKGHVSQG